ncbi:RNA polymerase sigma factor [Leptolyngbya sp. FACHB-261]|uniref:RNA polymerase sigma factor n=1 Tax=Leptolyngbya sp. FACHB-261 TaxID=2692806 RepID=UPI00168435C8|nr:sigma-70 family RNA polymerase sigma factor [Leptolyngbya sp. FACHB-261]MBD2099513.1 sigma-70 family RNA polymerase sigma factor [Leptolyngbya sp. FACHB-261]
MQLPYFPECSHDLIRPLFRYSDQDLVTLCQRHPEAGRYFAALFCRYGQVVYTLISSAVRSPVQADYLFAKTWRHIQSELMGLDLRAMKGLTLQSWLINLTAVMINRVELPPVEAIHYSLTDASPPLWCYLQQAMDQLPGDLRLILLLAETFRWSEARITAYLQAEGEAVSPTEVRQRLSLAHEQLMVALPEDIQTLYLARRQTAVEPVVEMAHPGLE